MAYDMYKKGVTSVSRSIPYLERNGSITTLVFQFKASSDDTIPIFSTNISTSEMDDVRADIPTSAIENIDELFDIPGNIFINTSELNIFTSPVDTEEAAIPSTLSTNTTN